MTRISIVQCLSVIIFANKVSTSVSEDASGSDNAVSLCDTNNSAIDYDNYTVSTTELCACKVKRSCVRKCCRDGFYHYHNENLRTGLYISICMKHESTTNFSVPIFDRFTKAYDQTDRFMVGMLSCNNDNGSYQYFKMNKNDPRQKYYIQTDGTLFFPYYEKFFSNDRYCVDEGDGLTTYLCFPQRISNTEFIIHVSAKLVPVPFLIATFLVYASLLESSLHNSALMFHVLSLSVGFTTLATAQYYKIEHDFLCEALGYSIVYFMLASFLWMNVICIDIWSAFSDVRQYYGQNRMKRKLLATFHTYSWGLPGVLVLALIMLDTFGDETSKYNPRVGKAECFLNGNLPVLLYYISPILVILVINMVLFILTAINIYRIKKETSMLKRSGSNRHYTKDDERKYRLYWKLLFVMGINPVINTHLIHTISWIAGWQLEDDGNSQKYIYFYKDFSHTMYGIIIFIIFVCKRKIWILLKKRFNRLREKNQSSSMTPTPSSNDSAAVTDNGLGYRLGELKSRKGETL